MADKSLLDTDILSEILRAKNATVIARVAAYRQEYNQLTISSVTLMEIVKGFHKMEREEALQRFLQGMSQSEILSFDTGSAEIAGRIYGDLEKAGLPIGQADVMIASIAIHHRLLLVTGNQRHYQRIQQLGYGLQLDNWRDEIA